jgi:translocation and assembly module TamB
MSKFRIGRKWWLAVAAIVLVFVGVPFAVMTLLWSGWADNYVRRSVVEQVARMTGGTVELGQFHFNPWRLLVTLGDLTIHGREPSGTPPFFHVDRMTVQLRIDSLWQRKVSLGDVEIARPAVHVRVEEDGSSNVPGPKPGAPGKPIRQRIFDVVTRRLRIEDGNVLYNDVRIPLVAEGGQFEFALDYSEAQGGPAYFGDLRWQQMELAARRYLPFPSDITARFTLRPDSFSLTQLVWSMPHTSLDVQLSLASFVNPAWTFRYRGALDLQDIQTILRKPTTPQGKVDFLGNGQWADGKLALNGNYSAQQIAIRFQWFHSGGINSRGTYHADRNTLDVPDFEAHALDGFMKGQVHLDFAGLHFRVDSHGQSIRLATLLAAVDNPSLPVVPLHWDGLADVQAKTTWNADFKNLDSQGVSVWMPPANLPPGDIPVTARFNYHYSMLTDSVSVESSELSTPTARVQMSGVLGKRDSAIETVFDSQDILPWDDFINRLRGKNADPKIISGRVHWQGRLSGPLAGPTFSGHVVGTNARYDRLYWDEVEGDMSYSPDAFSLLRGRARRGGSTAQMEISLTLDNWNFYSTSPWTFDATLVRTETDGLQALLGTAYPVHGLLSGTFHGSGTRADPQMKGLFDIINPEAWGWQLDRARGEIALDGNEVQITNAELRLLPPPAAAGAQAAANPGLITGNFRFGLVDRQAAFHLTGALLPLEGIGRIQTPRLSIGGRLNFQLDGEGPLLTPRITGNVRLVDLRLGSEVVGSFQSNINSDGRRLTLQMDSAMATGSLHGEVGVTLGGDFPLSGQAEVNQLDVDPLISSMLHLNALTGHSRVDGKFTFAGSLLRPDTLELQADLSRTSFDYEFVSLLNNGPVRFQYSQHEIRVQESDFRGLDSDFHVTGFARFTGNRELDMRILGAVNLQLFDAFVPNLVARGPAQVDALITGSLSTPRVTGRSHLQGASLRYGDFPTGLSEVSGDFIFDTNRMVFDNVTSQAGGGKIVLSGALSYGNGTPRYDVTVRADQVRIRYPMGMSWHADGNLRLSGTSQAAVLSGRVTMDRLLLADNFDVASLLGSTQSATAAPAASAFLRNLELDVQADTTPNALLQWPSGNFQTEASVRLRGTWQQPILLGNIHMLSGDMQFRGNRYQLSRGDLNFANPFRLDPILNIEATTRVQEYTITVDFTGPASHLTMSYRSEPPLPSSDVITLLALGQTGEESQLRGLAATQTPEMGATTLLSEAISSQLGGRVQRLFGISHFSVDPLLAGATTGQNTSPRITVEQQFSQDLTVTYISNVTSTQYQVIQIEYTLRKDISVIALRDENGTFGMDIIFRRHLK